MTGRPADIARPNPFATTPAGGGAPKEIVDQSNLIQIGNNLLETIANALGAGPKAAEVEQVIKHIHEGSVGFNKLPVEVMGNLGELSKVIVDEIQKQLGERLELLVQAHNEGVNDEGEPRTPVSPQPETGEEKA